MFEFPRSIYRSSKKHAKQLHLSIESRNRCTKDEDITVFYNWLRRILSSTANASTYNMILRELLLYIILLSFIFPLIDVFAQHSIDYTHYILIAKKCGVSTIIIFFLLLLCLSLPHTI